jgi:EAL domain-containing protein (putative c-di-GMP-specific phosphodiesterase class I)/CheY-like chemotaxis protein
MTEQNSNRLLVIDDEEGICEFVAEVATDLGFAARLTTRVEEFRTEFKDFNPTIIVMDLQMPDIDGIELLRELAAQDCEAQIVLISGMDSRVLSTAERLGKSLGLKMLGVLCKPIMLEDLEATLEKAASNVRSISESDLTLALELGQIQVYYQPKARRIGSGWRVDAAEALVRWRHPKYGLILPNEFIPLAESSGVIGPLTDFVFREVARQIGIWQEEGHSFKVAVNCSAVLIDDLHFPDRLAGFMKEFDVDPAMVVVELTESAAMMDPQLTMDILARLRLKNFGLSVDDFGTGFSSLAQLYRMPFNELKIDSSFVGEMVKDAEAQTIVETLVVMAKKLGMQVCAEGVESSEALALLGEMNCDSVQGFLISPAVPAHRFLKVAPAWNSHGDPTEKGANVVKIRSSPRED